MPDPKLYDVMESVKAVLTKNEVCGLIVLASKTHLKFTYHLGAPWSCAWMEEGGLVRIKAKREDFPSQEAQIACLEATAGMMIGMHDWCRNAVESIGQLLSLLSAKVELEHRTVNESPPGLKVQIESQARLIFALEAALPFVESAVGGKPCSSNGGPAAIKKILEDYNWDVERWNWIQLPNRV